MGRNADASILKMFPMFRQTSIFSAGTFIGPELDTSKLIGRPYIYCSVGVDTGGVGQTFTLEESDVTGSGFVAVPLADIPNNLGGLGIPGAPSFALAYMVTFQIDKRKRFLRLKGVMSGAGISSWQMTLFAHGHRAPVGLSNGNLL